MFTEANPDKGTETKERLFDIYGVPIVFTEANPDKGTETSSTGTRTKNSDLTRSLQKLTPIRGRKLLLLCSIKSTLKVYRS